MPPTKPDKELEQLKLDVATLARLLLDHQGLKPPLVGIIQRYEPERLTPERRPA
jgi:hypothetical protein